MSSPLILGSAIFLLSAGPLGILNGCLYRAHRWTAFRVYALWQLAAVTLLVPLAFLDFPAYSVWTWRARSITLALTFAVVGELWRGRRLGLLAGIAAGALLLGMLPSDDAATLWRAGNAVAAVACLARVRATRGNAIAAGLAISTAVPAIAEMPQVLEFGGWSRLAPVAA